MFRNKKKSFISIKAKFFGLITLHVDFFSLAINGSLAAMVPMVRWLHWFQWFLGCIGSNGSFAALVPMVPWLSTNQNLVTERIKHYGESIVYTVENITVRPAFLYYFSLINR